MLSPALHGGGTATRIASFFALCIALSSCNATAPLTASLLGSLPRPAQAGGLALWNTLASVAGYVGPAVFGWMKEATGGNTAGMAVRFQSRTFPYDDFLVLCSEQHSLTFFSLVFLEKRSQQMKSCLIIGEHGVITGAMLAPSVVGW